MRVRSEISVCEIRRHWGYGVGESFEGELGAHNLILVDLALK